MIEAIALGKSRVRGNDSQSAPGLEQELLGFLSSFVTPQRLALFQRVLQLRTRHLTVVLENAANPNDAAAVMRSCECFGVQDVSIVASPTGFKASPGVVVGSSKWLTTRRFSEQVGGEGIARCLGDLRERGYAIATLSLDSDLPSLASVPLERKLSLWLGREGTGADAAVSRTADYRVRLPSRGFSQDLNLSVCAAVCLSLLCRRLHRSTIAWSLSETEKLHLQLEWLAGMRKRLSGLMARFQEERGLKAQDLANLGLPRELKKLLFP